jgi:hypothetical protein
MWNAGYEVWHWFTTFALYADSRFLSVKLVMKLQYPKAVLHAELLGVSKRRWDDDMNMEFHISLA